MSFWPSLTLQAIRASSFSRAAGTAAGSVPDCSAFCYLQGSKWSGDSRLDEFCPFDTDLGAIHSDGMIPCMADELEQFSEHLTLSLPW